MDERKQFLGEFEELVLLAILKMGNEAYGVSIAEAIEEATENHRRVSVGALYTTLSRLEEKGFISSWMGEKTEERGGRAKKHFKIDIAGKQALQNSRAARQALAGELNYGFM